MWRKIRIALLLALAVGTVSSAQQLDICGCKNNPATLGAFDTLNSATWPPGTQQAFRSIQIPLPADGVMVFSSMNLQPRPSDSNSLTITFIKNAANTPVTLLVSGNMTIATQTFLSVQGDDGGAANANTLGIGGNGGPGGSRGGDGAYQLVNFANFGGAGLGPSGGAGGTGAGTTAAVVGAAGTFVSASDLLPLVGGSGGGGGASTTAASGCAGGGGGGGGGGLLMAVNGTLTINGEVDAYGGNYGIESNAGCSSSGGPGSGGAVRILANTLAGSGHIYAYSGTQRPTGARVAASTGAIRMEVLSNNFLVGNTDPLATRTPGPGPLSNLVNPSVAITGVAGQPISPTPQGVYGIIDLVLPVPGATSVDFSTSGVPVGTTVNVTVKPRVGGTPTTNTILLSNCDANGSCLGTTSFNLAAGAYFVEARATFQTP